VLTVGQEGAAGAFAAAATRALPRDIAAFTGRQAELAQLMGTLAAAAAGGGGVVGVHAVDGMAGIGKPIPTYRYSMQGVLTAQQQQCQPCPDARCMMLRAAGGRTRRRVNQAS
jgi:hypothetical protein